MANRVNRFAALSPEFEEEERKKVAEAVAKSKKDEKKEAKTEARPTAPPQSQPAEADQPAQPRGEYAPRGRGYPRGYGGNRGSGYGGVVYVPKGSGGQRDSKDFRFRGDANAAHPYDRRSGTGRGTDIPKGGSGRRNWGTPGAELDVYEQWEEERQGGYAPRRQYAAAPAAEPKGEATVTAPMTQAAGPEGVKAGPAAETGGEKAATGKEGEQKEGEEAKKAQEKKNKKRDRKRGKKEDKKEETEETIDPNAISYSDYLKEQQKTNKDLPTKKPIEVKTKSDAKKESELIPHQKQIWSPVSEQALKKAEGKGKATNPEVLPPPIATATATSKVPPELLGTFASRACRRVHSGNH